MKTRAVFFIISIISALFVLSGCYLDLEKYLDDQDISPQFAQNSGQYNNDLVVEIFLNNDKAADIYYTTDGTDPDSSSLKYTGPFTISGPDTTITIKAIAVYDDGKSSDIATVTYTIRYPLTRVPGYSLPAGTYNCDTAVSLSFLSDRWEIHYTTDGSDPDENSDVYSEPFILNSDSQSVMIKAVYVYKDMTGTNELPVISKISTSYYRIDYDYDNSQIINNLTVNDYEEKIHGKWIGYVDTPWTSFYNVEIEFFENGTYSSDTLTTDQEIFLDYFMPAFYYGENGYDTSKTYRIFNLYASGQAEGDITGYFTGDTANVGSLKYISFYNDFDNLEFEFWHRGYGPVKFNLTRADM